jgi:hypothetical protein
MSKNSIKKILISLKLSTEKSFELYYETVRDRNDIEVLKCSNSGVIILSKTDHIIKKYYIENTLINYWGSKNHISEDEYRRTKQFNHFILDKIWVDFGTGRGGILDVLNNVAKKTIAVELQKQARNYLIKKGYETYKSIDDIPYNNIEVVTLFHVFEHLINPIKILKKIKSKMTKNGIIIIEVPHANDVLLSKYDNKNFKKHTFWSQHLILHTKESLRLFIESAGFDIVDIYGVQRYPLANHLYWLSNGLPNGQNIFNEINIKSLNIEYETMLKNINMTDTLVCVARNHYD